MIAGSCQGAGDATKLAVRKPYGFFVAFDTDGEDRQPLVRCVGVAMVSCLYWEVYHSSPDAKGPFVRTLVAAADQSIVVCGAQQTVIAGYHWFSDAGRDPIIARRGLTLVTGRIDVAKSILLSLAQPKASVSL